MVTKQSSFSTLLTALSSIIFVAVLITGAVYLFFYFKGFKQDIMINDEKVEIMVSGSGTGAQQGDTVIVNYVGSLKDGTEFDNSYKRGTPFSVTLGEGMVIEGWDKGLLGIKVGEKRKLTIPPVLGYGNKDVPDGNGDILIPANSVLIFEVEAVAIYPRAN